MQQLLHAWDLADQPQYEDAAANVVSVDYLRRLQASLTPQPMTDDALRGLLEENLTLIEAFARSWQALASERSPTLSRYVDIDEGPRLDISPLVLQPVSAAMK
jgi:hypothetical protein